MPHSIFLIVTLLAPVLVLTILRINAVMVFLSLCLGQVLVQFVASEANTMVALFAPRVSSVSTSMIQIGVLLLPAVLTSVFMVFSVSGRGKLLVNVLPALGVGLLTALMVVPLLPHSIQTTFTSQPLWSQLSKLQALIVGMSAVVSLFFLWAQRKRGFGRSER